MTLVRHELRQGAKALAIWSAAIGGFMAICVFMYPQMRSEMEGVTALFAAMGAFTAAFGMDRLSIGTFIGFYALECGNILGMGGAFFASLTAINALAKEERERTAEFLLTHPVGRGWVITQKLLSVLLQIAALNAVVVGMSLASMFAIGEDILWKDWGLLHLGYFCMQVELCCVCFGLSAFLRRGGPGIGIGLAAMLYVLNLIANIAKDAAFLKYVTPFGYAEGADIITNGRLDATLLALGALYAAAGLAAAYGKYATKDIH